LETKSPFVILLLFIFYSHAHSQVITSDSVAIDSLKLDIVTTDTGEYYTDEDSLDMPIFMLKEVMVVNRPEFQTWEDRKAYYILRRRVRKVYPYAVLAGKRLNELDVRLDGLSSKRKKKKYIKKVQMYIENEFGPTLKKFTQSEGRILIKLIYRQTGINTYDIVKKYKSGWSAFWTNATASMFNLSLKADYNPFQNRDDLRIEAILIESFKNGTLKQAPPFWEELSINDPYFNTVTPLIDNDSSLKKNKK
jgi:hypothetical protein